MVALIIGMLICVGLAVAVVALVAVPARQQGRDVLTPQGEELVALAKERTDSALEKTTDALSSAKDKVTDTVSGALPGDGTDDVGRHRAS